MRVDPCRLALERRLDVVRDLVVREEVPGREGHRLGRVERPQVRILLARAVGECLRVVALGRDDLRASAVAQRADMRAL